MVEDEECAVPVRTEGLFRFVYLDRLEAKGDPVFCYRRETATSSCAVSTHYQACMAHSRVCRLAGASARDGTAGWFCSVRTGKHNGAGAYESSRCPLSALKIL